MSESRRLGDADVREECSRRARVTRSPVPLSRNEAVFKPGTYRLFIQISNTHVKLSFPLSSPLDRSFFLLCQFRATYPAQFTNQYFTVRTPGCAPAGGRVGGCSTPRIARRLPAVSRQVDITARVRGVNVPFKIRMLQHVTSTSWPPYSAFVFADRP